MKRGFTLVELLAVILILAFIALIAVPLVLDIIEDSKVESIRLSVEYYLDGVEKSILSNMTVDGKNYDGIYTVKDNGKLLSSYDSEIYIDYTGNGLEEGIIQIEDGKAVRLSGVKIKGYYAKLENEKVNLYKDISENTLVSGTVFNQRIKQFIDESATIDTADTGIISIAFLSDGMLPRGYTKESLEKLNNVDLSSKNDESIIGYYDNNGNIYVYSDNYILMNSISNAMFYSFKSVKEINFNGLDTSNVTNMSAMFRASGNIEKLDLSYFNTEKVTDMSWMFLECTNLKELDLSNWNTSSLITMWNMFCGCTSLAELDLKHFNTSQVINMNAMFANCSSLTKLDLSNFDTRNVINMGGSWNAGMFKGCSSLTEINLTSFDTSKVTTMYSMFAGCTNLKKIDLTNFDTSQVTDIQTMFNGCTNLETIIFGKDFTTSSATTLGWMFNGCPNLKELDLSYWDTSQVIDMMNMFINCKSLTNIKFGKNFNTSKVKSMRGMFYGCSSLEKLDVSNFDTSSVTTMLSMFSGCSNLTELDVSNFNTSQVTTMDGMFQSCINLKEINVSKWDTSQIESINTMFKDCNSLKSMDLSNFKTDLLVGMFHIFEGCNSIESIIFGENFNTSQVKNFQWIFHNCYKLTTLDLSSWDTSQATDSGANMFNSCKELEEVIVSDKWTLDNNLLNGTKAKEYTLKN